MMRFYLIIVVPSTALIWIGASQKRDTTSQHIWTSFAKKTFFNGAERHWDHLTSKMIFVWMLKAPLKWDIKTISRAFLSSHSELPKDEETRNENLALSCQHIFHQFSLTSQDASKSDSQGSEKERKKNIKIELHPQKETPNRGDYKSK